MDIKNLILIIIALPNIFLGLLIIIKSPKIPGNIYFGLTCIVGGLWALLMGLLHTINDINILNTYILRSTVFFSILVPLFYFLFSINYPFRFKNQNNLLFVYLVPFILSIITLLGFFNVEEIYFENEKLIEKTNLNNFFIFAIYFFVYILIAFSLLLRKYFNLMGIHKIQIRYILISTFITFFIVILFSIILPLINRYFYDWFSPIFTLINFIFIGYLIFLKPKSNN